jgi:tetratricopeptide (TPR) repeat protein
MLLPIKKRLFTGIFVVLALFCNAQSGSSAASSLQLSDTLSVRLTVIENSSSHSQAINELNNILDKQHLNTNDKLAVQTALIHQLQEQQKWDICLSYCQQQIAVAHQQNNFLSEATFYKLLGNTYYHIPDKDKAVLYWKKSIAISEANHYDVLLEQCYHNIGAIYIEKATAFDVAEEYLQKAIQLSVANKMDTTQLGNLHYRLLATLYERTNRLNKAEELYGKVIERSKQMNDTARLTEALMFYSDVLIKEKKFEKAIDFSGQAVALSKKINRLDLTQTALEFHAKNLYLAGRYSEAYIIKEEEVAFVRERFTGNLNTKISEAEARFKNAELQHEKEITLVKAKKEKQIYILAFISGLIIIGVIFYALYQKKNVKQKLQLQQEKERLSRDLHRKWHYSPIILKI